MIAGTHKKQKLNNIIDIDIFLLRCDCFNGSFVNGGRETILYSFAPDKPPSQNFYKTPTIKKYVLSPI